ncbi:hypothetical protein Q7C36_008989 [Tachysurus vachellii]|uniref:Uncharacterized protein n=1 Tax=Tachysurus vachellii TaxID=175792 RepID=A0AA88NAL3_TACVA|nr:hypothetical protein Q7C36_008989 [Tachysurus vachellii]
MTQTFFGHIVYNKSHVTSTLYNQGHVNITTVCDNVELSCCNTGCLYNREGYNDWIVRMACGLWWRVWTAIYTDV